MHLLLRKGQGVWAERALSSSDRRPATSFLCPVGPPDSRPGLCHPAGGQRLGGRRRAGGAQLEAERGPPSRRPASRHSYGGLARLWLQLRFLAARRGRRTVETHRGRGTAGRAAKGRQESASASGDPRAGEGVISGGSPCVGSRPPLPALSVSAPRQLCHILR